jgi:transcriptional regulator with XRE-family HTH domain
VILVEKWLKVIDNEGMKVQPESPQSAILVELGGRLQRVRKRQGLTQDALADASGLGVATVRRIEDGSDSQLGSWIKLLKALGMTASIDGLLPEEYSSPMEEALGGKLPRNARGHGDPGAAFRWGDEQP